MAKINYRKEARGRECQLRIPYHCNGDPDTTVLCHLPGGGVGGKTEDIHGAYGCSTCHDAVDGRAKTDYPNELLSLWHHQGVIRTQLILMLEGKL